MRYDRTVCAAALRYVNTVRRGFENWLIRWHDILHTPLNKKHFTELGKGDSRFERDNAASVVQIQTVLCNRLHIALGGADAFQIEMASREVIANLSPLTYSQSNRNAQFHSLFSQMMSRSFWASTEDWQTYAGKNTREPIEPHIWRQWFGSWGVFPDNYK